MVLGRYFILLSYFNHNNEKKIPFKGYDKFNTFSIKFLSLLH